MSYYYFNPFSKQYYFQEGFHRHPFFFTLFQPYSIIAKLSWWIFKKCTFVRVFFIEKYPKEKLPIENIREHITNDSIMAYNLGTPGEEQKTTILGYNAKDSEKFFIKYAVSKKAQALVNNEALTLEQIEALDFVPKLKLHVSNGKFSLIKTDFLEGQRVSKMILNDHIKDILIELSKQKHCTFESDRFKLQTCFAHGDFCPWNMMEKDGELKIFDWEMAGIYPIGYDLITYIFRTTFLLNPKKKPKVILDENKDFIIAYYKEFKISNIHKYIREIANMQVKYVKNKGMISLIQNWKELEEIVI